MTDITPQDERTGPVLVNVQVLRFVAAVLVVFHHVYGATRTARTGPAVMEFMVGVDIFFVISGFIMWRTAGAGRRGSSAWPFLQRRLIRIVPLYWLFTTALLLISVAGVSDVGRGPALWAHAIASYLFIPWMNPITGNTSPVMLLGWTLNYEMFFYVIFAASLLLERRLRIPLIGIVLVALSFLHFVTRISNVQLDFYAHPIVLEFLFGMLMAAIYPRVRRSLLYLLLAAAGFAWLLTHPEHTPSFRSLYLGVPATLVCAGAVFAPELPVTGWSRFLRLLGESSYALYLSHPFVLAVLERASKHLHIGQAPLQAAMIGTSVAVSVGVHLWLERPLTLALRDWAGRLRRPVQISAP